MSLKEKKPKERGSLAKAVKAVFVLSIITTIIGLIIIGTSDDKNDLKKSNSNYSNSSYGGGSSNNSSSGNGSRSTYAFLTTTTNISDAGSYTRFSNISKESGSSITLTASANKGYEFVGWYNGSTCLSSSTSYTFTMPSYDVTITAKFEIRYYSLTTTTNINGAGSYTEFYNLSKAYGSSITLTASANKGYKFVGWYNGSTRISSSASYTFTMPSNKLTVTANWQVDEEMNNFYFTSTSTSCGITRLKDKTVKSIVIPDYVTSIGSYAFEECSDLTNITVASGNTKYHSTGNCIIETATKTLIAGCQNSVIPNDGSVTSIDYRAFYGCSGLTSITIPDSVTSIGEWAFAYCSGLTSIIIPDSVTSIGESAFENCSSLTSVTIGNSVTSIGYYVFYGCSGLTSITYKGTKAQWNAISKGSNWKYNVPSSCKVHCTDGDVNI